jgi:hypothetical protein
MLDKKLGYYICNGQHFDSKIKAFMYSLEVKQPVAWNFNNRAFNENNWAVEPVETLDQLYDARARELREKYDYIMLSYSGGADSHNILMAFIRQNLHIDEIVVNTMTKATEKFTVLDVNNKENKNAAAEYALQTLPRLKEVENQIPKTKITILDLTDHLFSMLEDVGDASWIMDKREQVNIAGATRFNYTHFDNIRKQFDKDKKIALVLGLEKPRTYIDNGNLYIVFHDRAANMVTVAEHIRDYTNSAVEYFYWSPNALKILTKQAHIIKHWLEAFPQNQTLWSKENFTPESYRFVHERILRGLLYTTWDNNWYQADKAVKDWYSEFDAWFYNGYSDTKAFRIWQEGLQYLENNLGPYVKKAKDGTADALISLSQTYLVGPILSYPR